MTEREHCEKVALEWHMSRRDEEGAEPVVDLIERERAEMRVKALKEAAMLVRNIRPAGGPWTSLGAAADAIEALAKEKP